MKIRIRETLEYCCYSTIVVGISLIVWWPWRYFEEQNIEYDLRAIGFVGLLLMTIAGLINLILTVIIIREREKFKNGLNLALGSISLLVIIASVIVGF